jgi:Ca2+-binding EF-hand superfamily protein
MTRRRLTRQPLFAALLGLAVAAVALSAAHADRRGGHDKMFMRHHGGAMEKADANGDGAIDAAEWNALFAEIDANDDGKLEADEMHRHHRAAHPEALAFMIAHHADENDDGRVTSAEWKAHVAELDEDDDGELSAQELRLRHRFHGGGGEEVTTLPPFAAEWDKDSDGSLGASELDAAFASLDEDEDGVLTFQHLRMRRR